MPTILRPSLVRTLKSIFAQDFPGRIQILLGIDFKKNDPAVIDDACRQIPSHCAVCVFDLGYSTSTRHGGLHPAADGGALRTIMSYAANSRYIAYLDDDNWWAPQHLSSLRRAIEGFHWAFSFRWFVDPDSGKPLCIDEWESAGPGSGVFRRSLGGFVDPNCLMIDKLACEPVLRWWTIPVRGDKAGLTQDRNVFHLLKKHFAVGWTGKATCYYEMDVNDPLNEMRSSLIQQKLAGQGGSHPVPRKNPQDVNSS